jgi:hypothetical protein
VFQALETINGSNATFIFLKLLRSIIDAYIEKNTLLLDRIHHAWISVFLTRIWLVWIDKMGKQKLDKSLTGLTKHWKELPHRSKNSTQQFFLTSPAVYSIELNAHCLTYLALLVIEGKLPDEVLAVNRFHSQTCEATFREARSLSSSHSSGVNFTVLKFMNLAEELSLFQKIKSQNEQLTSPDMCFPVHHKHKHSHLASTFASSPTLLPTKTKIELTIIRAFEKSIKLMESVGMAAFLRRNNLSTIDELNDSVRTLFDEKDILDYFSQEENDNDDDNFASREVSGSVANDESDDDNVSSVLEHHDDPNSLQPTFHSIRVSDNVPSHLSQSYFKVKINNKDKFVHKSSACWILTNKDKKLSADRTKRVMQTE